MTKRAERFLRGAVVFGSLALVLKVINLIIKIVK